MADVTLLGSRRLLLIMNLPSGDGDAQATKVSTMVAVCVHLLVLSWSCNAGCHECAAERHEVDSAFELAGVCSPRPCDQVSLQPNHGCRERQGCQVLNGQLDLLPALVEQNVGCSRYNVLWVDSLHCFVIEAVPGGSTSLAVGSVVPTSWIAHVIRHSVQIIYGRCHLQPKHRCVRRK